MGVFKFSPEDLLFTCLGLVLLLLDIVLDMVAVCNFYREEDYASLCILLLLLVGSSVLVQAFSWLWFSYEDENEDQRQTKVEKCLNPFMLKFLHVLQLGMYFRHAGVMELTFFRSLSDIRDPESVTVYLNHDLSMLRLIETFSESAPQLVLMLTIMLQSGELGPVTVLKACGSASAIAFSVTMYHRSLRSFLPDKEKQRMMSSAVYFLWNLLLISSRLAALALFASVLPCFVFAHIFCSWTVLFFFVWWSETDFMDSPCGEWLYRATVGLIWYFDWFNVAEGRTRHRTLLYHGYMLVDISLLCSLWCWKMSPDPPYLEIPPVYAVITAVSVVVVYILGLLIKMLYYRCYHPNLAKEELKGDTTVGQGPTMFKTFSVDQPDSSISSAANEVLEEIHHTGVSDRSGPGAPAPDIKRCNKRMRKLAENFYS
ncbi:XK-related protein 8-like isoform 2-T2 [Lycodopsis pacificus]